MGTAHGSEAFFLKFLAVAIIVEPAHTMDAVMKRELIGSAPIFPILCTRA